MIQVKFESEYGYHMCGTVGKLVSDALEACPNMRERRKALYLAKPSCAALLV